MFKCPIHAQKIPRNGHLIQLDYHSFPMRPFCCLSVWFRKTVNIPMALLKRFLPIFAMVDVNRALFLREFQVEAAAATVKATYAALAVGRAINGGPCRRRPSYHKVYAP